MTERILRRAKSEHALTGLSFNLFKEAGILLGLLPGLYIDRPTLERDQAICAGLLVRTVKLMTAVVQLIATAQRSGRREVVLALTRSIVESAVNCGVLCTSQDASIFDRVVAVGLRPERELRDQILANVETRGEKWPIEVRMLEAIERLARDSESPDR